MKKCRDCGITKPLSDYHVLKGSPQGVRYTCKECEALSTLKRARTPKGAIYRAYNNQRTTSRKRKHPVPEYSKQDLYEWAMQNDYMQYFDAWVESDYDRNMVPSFDRIDNEKPYSLDNLRIDTNRNNYMRQARETQHGVAKTRNRVGVKQFTVDGQFVAEYYSVAHALKAIGRFPVGTSNIVNVCKKLPKYNTAYGYKWEYA